MFQPSVNVIEIAARTLVVYFTVVIGLRVFGKRELGQMTPFDLVLLLTLSNAVKGVTKGATMDPAHMLLSSFEITKHGRAVLSGAEDFVRTVGIDQPL